MDKWDKQTIIEWNELGFYYRRDDYFKQWRLMGSKSSLSDFLRGLLNYAGGKSNEGISEHIHLGPYQYLKIMTWHHPLINRDCIGGSPDDLKRLKIIIEQKLSMASAGEVFSVGKEYAAEGDYSIKFFVMADNFVPSQIEFTE